MQHIGKFSAALDVVQAKGILRVQPSKNNKATKRHVPDKRQPVVFNCAAKFHLAAKFAGKVILKFEFQHAFLA